MWSEYDEMQYQEMKKDLENGDHNVNFNGLVGPLSLLIKAVGNYKTSIF